MPHKRNGAEAKARRKAVAGSTREERAALYLRPAQTWKQGRWIKDGEESVPSAEGKKAS